MEKAIPAFYACYLLRSTIRHSSLYVGSTPNPVRRLKQHNGEAKGGAARTSRAVLRPWEMTCLVTGFPSQVAALQFEWAWQNTHLTRHVPPDSRLSPSKMTMRISPRTGRMRKRVGRVRQSLTDRLANLHLLLQSRSFGRWPLKLVFYAEDVFRVWEKWTAHEPARLEPRVRVSLEESSRPPSETTESGLKPGTGIYAIDVGYQGLRSHLEKSRQLLARPGPCAFCLQKLPADGCTSVVCSTAGCNATGHLDCFATSFLEEEHKSLIPVSGHCPSCKCELQWIDIIKELSVRMRTPMLADKILTKRKAADSGKAGANSATWTVEGDGGSDSDIPIDEEGWHYLSDSDSEEDQENRVPQDGVGKVPRFRAAAAPNFSTMHDPVIEDSEWDDAEVVL